MGLVSPRGRGPLLTTCGASREEFLTPTFDLHWARNKFTGSELTPTQSLKVQL